MEGGGRQKKCQTIAGMLLLCAIALSLACFILHGLTKIVKQEKDIGEAATLEAMKGSILINGKELDFQLESVSASESNGLLHNDVTQPDDTELFDDMTEKAVWRRLNFSIHCGLNKMKLVVMGGSAAELQLDVGYAHRLPLSQVPETCGYSTKLNALGLVLIVPFHGCNVKQENGRYVLPMSWRETPVTVTCTKLPSLDETAILTTKEPVQQSSEFPLPHHPWSLQRSKRHLKWPPIRHYRWYPGYPHFHCIYAMPPPTTTTTTPTPILWNPHIDPHLLHKLLALQFFHSNNFQRPQNDHVYKHLAQQLLPHMLERPVSQPNQHLVGKYLLSKVQTLTIPEKSTNQKSWW
ncbi:uncharacterized protein LOC121644166 [Melanotaenia boesemani]|uniref:uncharacterized protein LOC121644166 n=1 Tax=Melanotaenia boesemani TaxID=1250792 RepID=UPI001C03B28F|nr:uncharacterized protein LOC121644166 [Melanotaenia boesemani]